MSKARRKLGRFVPLLAALGALPAACNDVIGIEDPEAIPISGGSLPDAGRGSIGGKGGGSGAGNSGGDWGPGGAGGGGGTGATAQPSMDAAIADVAPSNDAASPIDASSTGDAVVPAPDARGSVADSGGGGSLADARDAGLLANPGAARGTCGFTDIKNANADTSLFVSTQGTAGRKSTGADEIAEVYLTNFNAGVQRNLNVRIRGPLTAGKVIPLDDANTVEYYDVKTGAGWSSTAVMPPSGTLTITAVAGPSFSFTITSAKLGPILAAVGSFTLNGSGSANPQ